MTLDTDITYLKGVGPAWAKILAAELDIHTVADLLDYLPFRYVDRSSITTVDTLREDDTFVVLKGLVSNMQTVATGKFRERLTVDFFDGTGRMQLVWFAGTKWVRDKLKPNVEYLVMGRPTLFNGEWQISHPEFEPFAYVDEGSRHPFMPVYTTTEKMKQRGLGTKSLARLTDTVVQQVADSRQQVADSRQQVAGSRQQVADSRQQVADSRQQVADSSYRLPATGYQLPDSRQQVAGSRQQVADSRQQVADSRQQVADSSYRLPATGYQLPATSYQLSIPETLPPDILSRFRLMGRQQAMCAIHYPDSLQQLDWARTRLKFEELFFLQLDYQYARQMRATRSTGRVFAHVGDFFNGFYRDHLPFPLTGAQKRVIREVREDMRSGRQMNRLIQGDVGSGKTLVALMCMLLALDNGCQACLMAPTEILATQHYNTFLRLLDGLGVSVALLTGSVKASAKRKIKQQLAKGEIQLLIGTHALIEDDVLFENIGLVVIDEQHRFGVEQRSRLWTKSAVPPHILVMTATPIPRTLAMTLYGDLDCSVIDELPPGRTPVRTYHRLERHRPKVFSFLKQQIDAGRQVYFVYPLVHESEKLDLRDLYEGFEMVTSYFPRPQYQVAIVHGQLTAEEKAFEMDRFKKGWAHIMVATTVIEVGVDVPNATVMVIENAERFGLSQLHQLRGRVGRGADQSYCILMTKDSLSSTSRERIRTMCSTTDGFQIAEADLRLRGPGDIQGLQQSGVLNLRLASIVDDEPLVRATRDTVRDLLAADPSLSHYPLLQQYIERSKNKMLWSKIS